MKDWQLSILDYYFDFTKDTTQLATRNWINNNKITFFILYSLIVISIMF